MKELEAETGVGREAIRFYINAGLLPEPERPKRNVAIYTDEHVVRIRAIKHLQEKRYLPLSVIRTLLENDEAGALTASTVMPGLEHLLPALVDGATPEPPRPLPEVARRAGLPEAEVRELAELGVIGLGQGESIEFRDAAIVDVWGRLRSVGFTHERGYEPATLAVYVEMTRWLAREEVARFLERLSGRMDTRQAAELGAEGVRLGNELVALLRTRAIFETLNASDTL
jgi:DNA-binding transcriptional MerR regulator